MEHPGLEIPFSLVPAQSIAEVLAQLVAIEAALPEADGLKWFNFLYRRVTEAVIQAISDSRFHDPAWFTELDVSFANLYFSALSAAQTDPAQVPRAWRPLFNLRLSPGIHRIQFALAGMNAHINRDLPVALSEMAVRTNGYPALSSDRFQDYLTVNQLLKDVEEEVEDELLNGLPPAPILAEVMAMWSVEQARNAAWSNGEALWHLRILPQIRDRFLDTLDRTVGFAGRGLLIRTS